MKKYILFDIDEIKTALVIAQGEVERYVDYAIIHPEDKMKYFIFETKWRAIAEVHEDLLKLGKIIEINENDVLIKNE